MNTVAVPLETAQAVFDIAVGSMNFGSGFLDKEEVDDLRAFAELLGIDPMEATPYNHKYGYCPGHKWREYEEVWNLIPNQIVSRCEICGTRIYPDGRVVHPL